MKEKHRNTIKSAVAQGSAKHGQDQQVKEAQSGFKYFICIRDQVSPILELVKE